MSWSSLTWASEIRSLGSASSSLSTGRRLWPPARNLPFAWAWSSATASLTVVGRWNAKSFMSGSLLRSLGGLDRPPDLLGRGRHREVGDAERGQRIDDRVDHGGRDADRAALADALDAERVVGARGDVVADLEVRQVGRARHAVVHERSGGQLALGVVADLLVQRLADALGEAAVGLPVDDHRVDDRADVVGDRDLDDLGDAGLGVDLDLDQVAAAGVGEVLGIVVRRLLETGLEG